MPVFKKVCPLIVTIHDLAEFIVPEKYGMIKSWGKRFAVLLCVRRSDFIITVSESTKESIVRLLHYPPDSIGVTIEGLHRPAEEGDCEYIHERYNLPAKYILYVGVIEKTKQVESIIKAFALLHESLKKEHAVIIVGEKGNAYGNVMATVHACSLDKKVRFLGYVPDRDLYCIYKKARAFVFPSRIEGFGLPVLEAMGYGTPVIASDIPVISEVTGDAAFLVNTDDIYALGDIMEKVLRNEAIRIELSSKGMARSRLFSWYNTAERTLSIYKKLAGLRD
jgi:glycosyltransferase involved in cell wall biosynthesis